MNVWIVSDGEPLPTDEGKVRLRRMGMLSSILSGEGHEVHWFSSSFHHYKKVQRCNEDKDITVSNNFIIHLLRTNGYKKNISFQRICHYKNLAKKFLLYTKYYKKPDIILATMAPLELSKAAIGYGEQNSIPVVIDIRDLWPEIFDEVVPWWGKVFIRPYILSCKKQLEIILKKSTSIIGVTPNFLKYGLSIAKLEKRVFDEVFYTSYKPRDFSVHMENFEEQWAFLGLRRTDFIIVFLGNFGRQYILEPIINTAEKLKQFNNIKFVLCGVGEYLNDIRKKSSHLDNVILPGWIEEEQILSLLATSSIGIAPYRNSINFTHNTPNKFGEYLSASLPVLLGIDGIMADLVYEYNCGATYKDADELALIIENLYYDKKLLKSMSENAYRLYNEKFNSDKVYVELSKHLQDIVKEYNK